MQFMESPVTGLALTSTAAAAMPFQFWTGTLRFRFQVICSNFHKGRLKIAYDPYAKFATEFNTNFVEVIDIAEKTDFTLDVKPGQADTWMEHLDPSADGPEFNVNTSPLLRQDFGNGTLSIYVVNQLTSPSVSALPVQILCYVSGGDDFEVAAPTDTFQRFSFFPQSGKENADASATDGVIPEQTDDTQVVGEDNPHPAQTNLVFMGESIPSFRTMLKRPNRWLTIGKGLSSPSLISMNALSYPMLKGAAPEAAFTTGAGDPYNYVNFVMMHYVSNMFAGWRGAIRYKLTPESSYDPYTATVERDTNKANNGFSITEVATPTYATASARAYSGTSDNTSPFRRITGVKGAAFTTSDVNPVLEWEIPFYSKFRYVPGKHKNYTGTGTLVNRYFMDYNLLIDSTSSNPITKYNLWVSAGEDFQCYMYTGLPRLFRAAQFPPP
jgi:hypothetical protein